MKICGIYKITNIITGDFYIGSSKDIKRRWTAHKCPSTWKKCPNNPLYQDFQKYGVDKFEFQILEEVEEGSLKEEEQQFIEILKLTYNNRNANGLNVERRKKTQKKASKEYEKTDKRKEYKKSDKYKEIHRKSSNKYGNQLCIYNGEVLKLCALSQRFSKAGIKHPTLEAKKYLLQ